MKNECKKCIYDEFSVKQFPCCECTEDKSYFALESKSRINRIAEDIATLVNRKNNDYGNSFGKLFEKYGYMSYLIRINDKISRLESLTINNKEQQVKEESVKDTLMDIVGYTLLMLNILEGKGEE